MDGPGSYVADATEGIGRIEDLPPPQIVRRSRNDRRRSCPRCGRRAYRLRTAHRMLHDLGDPMSGRPRKLEVICSQHHCRQCNGYFNADMPDLALPNALTFLDDSLLPATSDAVERGNRRHRKMQKTVYRVRTGSTIRRRIALDVQRELQAPVRHQTIVTLHRQRRDTG